VSCTATNACTAGGDYGYFDAAQSVFAQRWNGTAWVMQHQPNPTGQMLNADNSVSCTDASTCTMVGSWLDRMGRGQPLAQRWNGTAWTGQHPPSPKGNDYAALGGVSCTSAASCIAVGKWTSNPNLIPEVTLAETWNGTAWTIQPTPNPATAKMSHLDSVACPSATACVAVGSYWNGTITQTLTETYTAG
jgi:hypothetical protein